MLESGKSMPSVDAWLREAKADASAAGCGMYLTHNGVVRATPKSEARGIETGGVAPGHRVGGMVFGFDADKVQAAIEATRAMPGIGYVRVWLASGVIPAGILRFGRGGATRASHPWGSWSYSGNGFPCTRYRNTCRRTVRRECLGPCCSRADTRNRATAVS